MPLTLKSDPKFSDDVAPALPGERYRTVRAQSVALCAPLATEDYVVQAMADVSPPKWHLAHATWFFENFVLIPFLKDYRAFHPEFSHLFNSYYETVGRFFPRHQRGVLARPTVEAVYAYRDHVDAAMLDLLASAAEAVRPELASRTLLGLHHEQQHQELLLTDIKYNFAINPLRPVYRPTPEEPRQPAPPSTWLEQPGGLHEIGHDGSDFAFDNETPRHPVWLGNHRLAARPVCNGEFIEFIESGGYGRPELWLADGWGRVRQNGWQAPLYWERIDETWWHFTLAGLRRLDPAEPVCHVSHYEADAFARWRGARLPTEMEWECLAAGRTPTGNLLESEWYHPAPAPPAPPGEPVSLFGDTWEWTQSSYAPYPGFQPLPGSLGEYNGKFMCGQVVLRGGSCATPASHIRATYRNFFRPWDRWQFSGIRLAEDVR